MWKSDRKTKEENGCFCKLLMKPADQRKHTVEINLFEIKRQTSNFNLLNKIYFHWAFRDSHSIKTSYSFNSCIIIQPQIQVLGRKEQGHIYFILVISIHQNPVSSLFLTHPARAFLCFLCHISNHQYNVFVPIFSDQVKFDTADNLSTTKTRLQWLVWLPVYICLSHLINVSVICFVFHTVFVIYQNIGKF